MSKSFISLLVVMGVVGFFLLSYVGSVFSFRADAVKMEQGIIAQHDQNRNNYDNMWKKFKEMAQVPEQYSKDLREVYVDAIEGRYGPNGSQAVFQFLQEQNPQLDSLVYKNVQVAIEAGRNSFQADQTQLISKKQEYTTLLRSNRALWVNWILNFPKIDLAKYDIVTSDATDEAFDTKKVEEVDVFSR